MSEPDYSVKISLIGSSGVGKTCVLNRFSKNLYADNPNSTLSASFSEKVVKIGDKIVKCDLWDTAGQEKYRTVGKMFYKDSYIIFLVYSITNKKSFEEIQSIWYPDVKKFGEQFQIIGVVGNKCDLFEEEQVSEEDGRKFAEEINAKFFLVSAKSGVNINTMFESLIEEYLGEKFQYYVEKIQKDKETRRNFSISQIDLQKNKRKCC